MSKPPNRLLLDKCRSKLHAIARHGTLISYGDLAHHVGVVNQGLGPCLNAIYEEEMASDHPDVTLVAVYAGTKFGRYNSRGKRAQSVRVDPSNRKDVLEYEAELARVYKHWKR